MYGGDEVSAIVIYLGCHTCKAGYAGEDAPKAVFPSVAGSIEQLEVVNGAKFEKESESISDPKGGLKGFDSDKAKIKRKLYVGSQALGFRRDHMDVISPFKDGVITDWDIVDNIWAHAFRERLLIDPKEHPMLYLQSQLQMFRNRERERCKKYPSMELRGLFQYLVNQLKKGVGIELILLQELIQQMSNVQYTENMTEEQLDATEGSETLRFQATLFGLARNNKRMHKSENLTNDDN